MKVKEHNSFLQSLSVFVVVFTILFTAISLNSCEDDGDWNLSPATKVEK